MKRLLATLLITAALLSPAAFARAPLVGGAFTEDSCACGGTVTLLFTIVSWPNGMTGEPMCERHWSNGTVTYTLCY